MHGSAYQMHRPSDQSGIVVAFRRKDNQQGSIRVRLRGVDPAKTYRVLNDNDGTVTTRSARSWPRASTCRSPRRRARCCCAIRKQGNKPASAPEIVGEPSFRKRRTKRDALPERAIRRIRMKNRAIVGYAKRAFFVKYPTNLPGFLLFYPTFVTVRSRKHDSQ